MIVGQVDLDPHGPVLQVLGLGHPADLSLEDPSSQRVDLDGRRVADVAERHVRVGNLHDRSHPVVGRHGQQGLGIAVRRRSNERSWMNSIAAKGDHSIERRFDPGVACHHLGSFQVGLRDRDLGLGGCQFGLGKAHGRRGFGNLGVGRLDSRLG